MAFEKKLFNANGFVGGSLPSTQGDSGLVPAPSGPDANRFLRGNGQWDDVDAPTLYSVSTTDATPTAIFAYTIPDGDIISVSADILVFEGTGSTVHGSFLRRALATRFGGTVTLSTASSTEVGQTQGTDDSDNAGLHVTFIVNTTDIKLIVTGVVATSLSWTAKITSMQISPGPS